MENLEDNREWFASQLSPDSPSSNEIQRNGANSLDEPDGSNLQDNNDLSPTFGCQKIVDDQDGNICWNKDEQVDEREEEGGVDEEEEEEEEGKEEGDDETTISEAKAKHRGGSLSSSSSKTQVMNEEKVQTNPGVSKVSNQVLSVSSRATSDFGQESTDCQEAKRKERDPLPSDKLHIQAEKIQFQIILDEPETEIMNCDNISSSKPEITKEN